MIQRLVKIVLLRDITACVLKLYVSFFCLVSILIHSVKSLKFMLFREEALGLAESNCLVF